MNIRSKLILSFLISILIAIGSISTIVFLNASASSRQQFEDSSLLVLARTNDFMHTFIEGSIRSVNFLATIPDIPSIQASIPSYVDTKEKTTIPRSAMAREVLPLHDTLVRMAKANDYYDEIFMGLENGGFFSNAESAMPAGYDPRKRPWYREMLAASSEGIVSKAYMSTSGYPVSSVMRKLRDSSGKVFGVIAVDINLSTLTRVVSSLTMGQTGYVVLIEDTGIILADPKHKEYGFKKVDEVNVPAYKAIMSQQRGTFATQLDGKERFITVFTGLQGWKLAMIIDADEVNANAHDLILRITGIGFVVALALMALAWFIAQSIARPMGIMINAATAISKGDFSAAPDDNHFKGEMLTLHLSFKAMVMQLVNSLSTAEAKGKEAEELAGKARLALEEAEQARQAGERARREGILQTAERLGTIVEQISTAARELSMQVNEATNGAEVQRSRTAEAATAMEQMNASVLEVAGNASRASQSAESARKEADGGGAIVQQVVSSITQVDHFTREMSQNLNELGKQAEGIGHIMTVITDIADQTNLLALNAAIEAARAGEAGRGFAVVADEVRKLAEKTMTATKEVGEAISAIQRGTQNNIAGMGKAAALVNESTSHATHAGDALKRIVSIVIDTSDQVRSIATASEEQSAASEQINRSTEEVNRIASELAHAMSQASHAVTDLTRLGEDMQTIIRDLRNGN